MIAHLTRDKQFCFDPDDLSRSCAIYNSPMSVTRRTASLLTIGFLDLAKSSYDDLFHLGILIPQTGPSNRLELDQTNRWRDRGQNLLDRDSFAPIATGKWL